MTREEALNCIFVAHNIRTVVEHKPYLVDALWLLRTDVQKYINKIFNDHEAIIKAKDEEIERLKEAMQEFVNRCEKGEVRSRYTYSKFKELLKEQQ